MSEYQYYEFRAIDRPLTETQMAELRRLSTRAEITPTSFTNVYHWGSFKGDPRKLMHEYFDAVVYVANWGTHRLMFRLPGKILDEKMARAYGHEDSLRVDARQDHVVLDFSTPEEEPPDDWEKGEAWMPSLVSIRADLMRGDHRALYLGWLVAAQTLAGYDAAEEDIDGEELEPPVPPGLAKLSGPLSTLARFLRLDDELIEAAAAASSGKVAEGPSRGDLARWVASLPAATKDDALVRLLAEEEDMALRSELLVRFREEAGPRGKPEAAMTRRTVAQLLAARNALIAERQRKAGEKRAAEQAQREREKAEARARRLDQLDGKEDATWHEVASLIATRLPKNYDQAVALLADLRDLARRSGEERSFQSRFVELRERHRAKSALQKRLQDLKL